MAYYVLGKYSNWIKSEDDFLHHTEMESVLSVSAKHSTFAQHEKSCTGALGVVANKRMMKKLRNDRESMIDLSKATKSYMVPRTNKEAFFMSSVG